MTHDASALDSGRAEVLRWRRAAAILVVMFAIAAATGIVAVVAWRGAVAALDGLRSRQADACNRARGQASSDLHAQIKAARSERQFYDSPPVRSATALSVYVDACMVDAHHPTVKLGRLLPTATLGLFARGDFEALERLEREVDATPLEAWHTLQVPGIP